MSRRWKRGYLRKQRWRKIQNRIKVIKQLHPTRSYVQALDEDTPVGKFAKGHYGFLGMEELIPKLIHEKDTLLIDIKEHMEEQFNINLMIKDK